MDPSKRRNRATPYDRRKGNPNYFARDGLWTNKNIGERAPPRRDRPPEVLAAGPAVSSPAPPSSLNGPPVLLPKPPSALLEHQPIPGSTDGKKSHAPIPGSVGQGQGSPSYILNWRPTYTGTQ